MSYIVLDSPENARVAGQRIVAGFPAWNKETLTVENMSEQHVFLAKTGELIRFTRPSRDELVASIRHFVQLCEIGDEFGNSGPSYMDDSEFDDFDLHAEVSEYVYRIWWKDVSSECTSTEGCTCGVMTLTEVIDSLIDIDDVAKVVELHREETMAAYKHYWAGDAANAKEPQLLDEMCVDCLVKGPAHVTELANEAEDLGRDYAAGLAVAELRGLNTK